MNSVDSKSSALCSYEFLSSFLSFSGVLWYLDHWFVSTPFNQGVLKLYHGYWTLLTNYIIIIIIKIIIIIIIILIIIIHSFVIFDSALTDVFFWSLSDSKCPQVSRTLLSILAVLNNAVVWMVSTHPPTFKSSSPFCSPLVTVPNEPITIGIIVTCMFRSFFNALARSRYLSLFSNSFSFILWSAGTAKSTTLQVLFFLFFLLLLNLVFWPRLGDPFVC